MFRTLLSSACTIVLLLVATSTLFSQDNKSATDLISEATQRLTNQQEYLLKYQLKRGDVVRWNSEHTASTKIQMAGETETSASRSRSIKCWEVSSVDSKGNMTFVLRFESCQMWQQTDDHEPVTYNSQRDEEIPADYEAFAQNIGRPIATITMSPSGQVVDKQMQVAQAKFGVGDVTIPLPNKKVAIGYQWFVPGMLTAEDENGLKKNLETRLHFTLDKVKGGMAYISFQTEVLTPFTSAKVKSQIMQQMTRGYLVFDLAKGMVVRKEVDWDEKAQDFEGPGSYLKYVAKLSERLVPPQSAKQKEQARISKALEIKPIDGEPIMRK